VGISPFKPLTELSIEEFDRVIATNLRPVFITSRQLVLHRQQNGNRSYGRIINLCSTRYLQSEAGTEAYSASKGGIYSLTHSLAVSLAPFHITVNAIAPGWIHVREEEQLRPEDHAFHPSGRVGTPEDIARACLFLCDEANDFLNGQTLTIDGGATIRMIYPE
ncbi:SDR family oxidoreductase, partial [Alistipes putredinis]